jgi:Mg-chelatase subunit ChlD
MSVTNPVICGFAIVALTAILIVYAIRRKSVSLSSFLRFLAASCLVIAFCGLELIPGKRQIAVFLVDSSESYARYLPDALTLIGQKVEKGPATSEAALVIFGGDASVETQLTTRSLFRATLPFQSSVGVDSTSIAAGIERTLSALPFAPEIYLFTDGQENSGSAELVASIAGSAKASGVRSMVFPVILATASIPDAAIEGIISPQEVKVAEAFPVEVQVSASEPGQFEVRLLTDHEEVGRTQIEIPATGTGVRHSVLFNVRAGEEHVVLLSAEIVALSFADAKDANNRFSSAVRVSGKSSIILASGEGSSQGLRNFLSQLEGAKVTEVNSQELPENPGALLGCDLVILDNVSAYQLSRAQMKNIRNCVESGGGVFVLGGPNSFGAGGYEETEIEKVLPVWSSPQKRRNLSLVLILDASGSMSESTRFLGEESTKFHVAAQAAASVVGQLREQDRIEIITFNVEPTVHFALSDVGDGKEVKAVATEKMARLTPSGGTNIYTALQKALEDLRNEDHTVRLLHVLLLSDGESLPGKFDLESFRKKEITVSVVATGDRVNRDELKSVCEPTGGVFYEVNKFDSTLREVFLKDFRRIPNLLIREKQTQVRKVSDSPVLGAISEFPPLEKLCITSPKEGVLFLLESDSNEPVLAAWNYGLGRSVAFTGSLQPGWGDKLLTWEKTGLLLAQIVRWCSRPQRDDNFSLAFMRSEKERGISVARLDAADKKSGKFLNSLKLSLHILTPSGTTEELQMTQIAPGSYAVEIPSPEKGLYRVSALLATQKGRAVVAESQFYRQASLEHTGIGFNLPLLYRIAAASGGKTLSESEFQNHILPTISVRRGGEGFTGWWLFAFLAAVFYIADVALWALRASARRETRRGNKV